MINQLTNCICLSAMEQKIVPEECINGEIDILVLECVCEIKLTRQSWGDGVL